MKWKELRYKSLPVILMVFLVIALILFAERSGIRSSNSKTVNAYADQKIVTAREAEKELEKDCLIIMDSTQPNSINALKQFRQIFRDMKVGYNCVDAAKEKLPSYKKYKTIVVLVSDMSVIGDDVLTLCDWVKEGGRVMMALTIQKNGYSDLIEQKLGVLSSDYDNTMVESVYPEKDFMVGGGRKFEITDAFESAWEVEISEKAVVYAHTGDEKQKPLVWENNYGKGKFVVVNLGIYEKVTRGFFSAAYSLLEDTCVYPVINASMFFLDGFPSPVPNGDGTYIRRDYGMDTETFYKNVWWPEMMNMADKYGVKYTGTIIENYGSNTSESVKRQTDTERFQYFGNMVLHQRGELGYYGYNHQPLSLGNGNYGDALAYKTWESYLSMKNSIEELISFGEHEFPAAGMSVYVPPSNVLSEEGRTMLVNEFPEIKTIAGSYSEGEYTYVQEFEMAADGIVEEPRIISGCQLGAYMRLAALSELNMHFVNSHFFYQSDLLDADRGAAIGWETLKGNLDDYMKWLYESAPSIRNMTGSEGAGAIQRFGALVVKKEETEQAIHLNLEHFQDEASLMVRVNKGKPGKVTGGTIEQLSDSLYLLHAVQEEVTIERIWEE